MTAVAVHRVMNMGSAPASSSPFTGAAGGVLGKDEFVKLLVAQMQNQDPLNPQNGQEMAAQLAQFSSVEQLININQTLGTQSAANTSLANALENSSAIGLIGKNVNIATNTVTVGGDPIPAYGAELSGKGSLVVSLVDANGKTVRSENLGTLAAGRQVLDVAGLSSGLPAGTYTIKLEFTPTSGVTTSPASFTTARVDGVQFGPTGLVLRSGNRLYPLTGVTSVDAAN